MSQHNTRDLSTFTQSSSTLSESVVSSSSYSRDIILGILVLLIGVIGFVGNSLVILAIILSRKLRSTINWFILNLACTDIISSVCLTFIAISWFPLPGVGFYVGWCIEFSFYVFLFCVGVSLATHALIACTSWYVITKNRAKSKNLFSNRNIRIMIAITWLIPFIPFIVSIIPISSENFRLIDVVLATWIFGHFVIIVIAYLKIWRFVAYQRKSMKRTKNLKIKNQEEIPMDTISCAKACANKGGNPDSDRNHLQVSRSLVEVTSSECEPTSQTSREISVHASECGTGHASKRRVDPKLITLTKNLLVVLFAFVISFVPYSLILYLPPDYSENAFPWLQALLSFNSCINPIIYARRICSFREVMGCIIRCQLGSIPMPITCLRRMMHTG